MNLNKIMKNTEVFIEKRKRNERKKLGQFFTPIKTVKFMTSLSQLKESELKICDPGSGNGMLGIGLCLKILEDEPKQKIVLDLYENDEHILVLLKKNVESFARYCKKNDYNVKINIFDENYILANSDKWNNKSEGKYSIIICNPPYKKLRKDSDESQLMLSIVKGQPNIYMLFMAMSMQLLKKNGEMIFITPRSFTSGKYFAEFRKWMFMNGCITNIHMFNSRSDTFKSDSVLQETVITRFIKRDILLSHINISTVDCKNGNEVMTVNFENVIDRTHPDNVIRIPQNSLDLETIKLISSFKSRFAENGYILRVGKVVEFRLIENLTNGNPKNKELVPLFYSSNLSSQNNVFHPSDKANFQWIIRNDETEKILVKNQNTLLMKRFTTKDEKRRLHVCKYMATDFSYEKVSFENHVNYFEFKNEIESDEMRGLFIILNSNIYDRYFRIINGNTQVNVSEINSLPIAPNSMIRMLGRISRRYKITNHDTCDKLIKKMMVEYEE